MKTKMRKLLALLLTLAMVLPMVASVVPAGVAATEVAAKTQSWDFSDESQLADFSLYQSATSSLSVADGILTASGSDGEMKAMVNKSYYGITSISVDMIPGEKGINGGIYLNASDVGNGNDEIQAFTFIVESYFDDANRIDVLTGSFPWTQYDRYTSAADHGNALYTNNEKKPVNLRLDFDDDNVTVTLSLVEDPTEYTQTVYYCDTSTLQGQIGLRNRYSDMSFDNLQISYELCSEQELLNGLTFTGENSLLVKTDAPVSQIPNTIEMWVKMNTRPNDSTQKYRQPLISSIDPSGTAKAGDFELLAGTDGTLWWLEATPTTVEDTTSAASFEWNRLNSTDFRMSEWMHVALTRQEGKVTLYVNGEQAGTWEKDIIGFAGTPTNPVTFGYSANQGGITRNNLDGAIGDVRLWSTVRTPEEIKQGMSQILTGTEEGLMNYWEFDEQSGTVFHDSVENGVDGTLQFQGAALSDDYGLEFAGVNEKQVVFESPVAQIPNTVEMCVYLDGDASGHHQTLISAYSGQTQAPSKVGDWTLDIVNGGVLRWVDKTSKGQSGQLKATKLPTDQWVNVAVTRENGYVKFYVNGELTNSVAYSRYEDSTACVTVPTLGYGIFDTHLGTNNYLDGKIKNVSLWSVTKTADEIKADMNKVYTGTETGLMNYWKLNETAGTTIADSASAGNDGTISGTGTSWCNEGVELLGYNQKVVVSEAATTEIPKTVELWVWLDSDSKAHYHSLISAYSATTQSPSKVGDWNLDIKNGNLRWVDHTSLGTSGQLSCAITMPTDQWAHLAITRSSDSISYYLNGELIGTAAYTKYEETTQSATKVILGKSIFDTHLGHTNYLDGKVRDVRLWNVTRTAEEIKADMNKTLTGTEAGLMNYWKIHEKEGTVIEDCVAGNDFHISEMTCVSWDQLPEEGVTYENTGLNNPHDRTLRTLNNVNAAPKSVEAWVKVPTNIGDDRRLTVISAYPAVNFHMDVYTNGRPRLWFENAAGSGAHYVVPNVDLRTNEWTHVAFVVNEDTAELYCYINGELVHTFTGVSNALTVKKLYVARDNRTGWQYPFMGQVADVRVWDKTLTAQEVKNSMNTADIGIQEGLLLNLPLDEGDNADVYQDLSGNENNVMVMSDDLTWIDVEKKPSDYSIAIIPDQQYLTASYVDKLNGIYQWLADVAEEENLQMVINVGDITDNGSNATHWQRALDAYNIIKDKVPYSFVPGNHDYAWNTYREAVLMNQYFPQSMFENTDTFGGVYQDGYMENTWHQFEIMGNKYLIVCLEFCPRDEVLEWANEIVASHPDHQAIIVTHAYMDHDGTWLEGSESFGADTYSYVASETEQPNDAAEMWDKLVRKHENIIMVLSGHIFANTDVVVKTDIGDHGNEVKQFLIDAQWLDSKLGGLGLVAMMNFSNDGQDVEFTYYCPYTGKYMNPENQFTFHLPKQADDVAQVGENAYTTVTEAVTNANGQVVTILADTDEEITISSNVIIDLAGCTLSNVTVAEGATLTLIDTATDDYEGEYGSATVTGAVKTFSEVNGKSYMVVTENGVSSAHCYDVALTHISLDASNDALGYKAKLYGDAVVQSHVESFGFNLWLSEDNVKTYGKAGTDVVTLRLKGILAAGGGEMNINATAFVTLAVGEETSTKTGTQQTTTMKETLQKVNAAWTDYTEAQQNAVKALCDQYLDTVSTWELTNIYPVTEETTPETEETTPAA